jgi:hypothetical protein
MTACLPLLSIGDMIAPIISLAITVVVIVGLVKVFTKAGEPGWAAIVPIYNLVVLTRIAGLPILWVILCLVPLVNLFAGWKIADGVAKHFGQSTAMSVACFFGIGYVIIGLGGAQYQQASEQ